MKKTFRRVFAIFMAMAIAFTAIPMMEVKAAEGDIVVESVTLPVDTITLSDTNTYQRFEGATIVLASGYENVSKLYGYYRHTETGSGSVGIWFYKTENSGVYQGILYGRNYYESGTYELYDILVEYEDGTYSYHEISDLSISTFNVVNNMTDFTAPVISNLTFAQNGQTFQHGENDTVSFTANFSDGDGVGLDMEADMPYAYIKSIDGNDYAWTYFEKQADGSYLATFDVDELSNFEWYVENFCVKDKNGNETWYYPMDNGEYWHFFVEDENGVCNKERTITVNFYNDEYEIIESETITASDGEVELATLLEEIPDYTFELGFAGWKCEETGQMLIADEAFLVTSTEAEFNFYPVAAQRYIEVDLYVLNERGVCDWTGYEAYLIDYDTTYAELFEMLPTPVTVNGCAFVEWTFNENDLTDVVDGEWVDLVAKYDKRLIELYCYYMDEKGDASYKEITVPFEYDEKVTYNDVINKVESFATYEGVNFLRWECYGEDIDDLTQEIESDWLEIEAVYDKYPVTIERTYIDATGVAKTEKTTKLYPAGTSMESIYEEYAGTPDDASSSVAITGWDITFEEDGDISRYNNYLFMVAEYADEVIVEIEYEYIAPMDNHGVVKYETIYAAVSKELAATGDVEAVKLLEYCDENVINKINVTHYDGYVVNGWLYSSVYDNDDDGYYDYISMSPDINFEDEITVFAVLYVNEEVLAYVYAVEAEETIVLPWSYEGYSLEWYKQGEDEEVKLEGYAFTVPQDAEKSNEYTLIGWEGKEIAGKADLSAEILDANDVLSDGVAIRAIELEKGEQYIFAKSLIEAKFDNVNNYSVYDITLVNEKGLFVEELSDYIKVSIEMPFDIADGNTLGVYRVEGEKLIECETTISNGYLTFETNHFSTYVFVELPQAVENQPGGANPPANVPPTGDTSNALPYILLLLFGAGIYMVGNKKRGIF